MPNRILREGVISSEPVNSLSWPAEVFYRRLMSVVDDFGRYYAKPELLRAACYPLQLDKVGNQDVAKWLGETQKAGLVMVYTVEGKTYVELLNFRQQVRAKQSKFPCQAGATHVHINSEASAHLDVVVDGDVSEDAKTPASSVPLSAANGEAVAYIPLADKSEWGVSKAFLAELEAAYPAVDGPATLREIRAWCVSNPEKRKTRRGVMRFVNRWFEKTQNA